jgi:hypothetical protein
MILRYINLARSLDRKEQMENLFGCYSLKRIEAIDGISWIAGYSRKKIPQWSPPILQLFMDSKDIAADFEHYHYLYPTAFACTLSHLAAIDDFIASDEPASIILEDDVVPLQELSDISLPTGCDFFYLMGDDHPGKRISTYENGTIRSARTLGAYMITQRAAHLMKKAMVSSFYIMERQIQMRIFKSTEFIDYGEIPPWEVLPRIVAMAPYRSIIGHSVLSEVSTFTQDGKKPWIPRDWDSLAYEDKVAQPEES